MKLRLREVINIKTVRKIVVINSLSKLGTEKKQPLEDRNEKRLKDYTIFNLD